MRPEESNTSSESSIDPDNRSEEDQILESIIRLRAEITRIISTTGPSKRSLSINGEIKRLLDRLANCKVRAKVHPAQNDPG